MRVIKKSQDLSIMSGAMESLRLGVILNINRNIGLQFQYRIAHNDTYRPVYPRYSIL